MNAEITALVATWRGLADQASALHVDDVAVRGAIEAMRECANELERLAARRPAPAPSMPEPSPARAGYPYTEAGDRVMAERFPAPPVGEAERQAAMLDADAALMEKEAPGSWAVAPPPADLVALVRRVMNAYTRELEARNAWVISAPQSRESFELFEVVQAREADTRAAFLALAWGVARFPLPEVPDGKA